MTRSEFIQQTVSNDQNRDYGIEGAINHATMAADALEASGVAPWSSTSPLATLAPAALTPVLESDGGERACAVFFQALGPRNGRDYVWADLPEVERRAWEEVSATLTGCGVGAVDIAARERDACAGVVEETIRISSPVQRQLLVHLAGLIRARGVKPPPHET